jgi:hypothetical protein
MRNPPIGIVQWFRRKSAKKKLEILLVLIIGEPGELSFVSGIYAETLHVEKCFLMYISRLSPSLQSTTVADSFFIVCNNSIL